MDIVERFKSYVEVDTKAGEPKEDSASDSKILNLSEKLLEELQKLNPDEISVNRYGIVDAKFKGTGDKPRIALLAHRDTSPQASDTNVKTKIDVYEGKDIVLGDGKVLSEKEFPLLAHSLHHSIIHSDGTTLLGGDDKAGIAIIRDSLTDLLQNKIPHRPLEIIFTTDEEIGVDAEHVSREIVKAKYGYTIDGGDNRAVNIETFTAKSRKVHIKGKSIHPGEAKDKLVSAVNVAIDFQNALPKYLRPEHTDNKEPFYHLCSLTGNEEHAEMDYIIRSFDEQEIQRLASLALFTARRRNELFKDDIIQVEIADQYHNRKTILDQYPEIVKERKDTYQKLNRPAIEVAVRGGTTGSQLSFKGLPCPNLGTGDYNRHGPYEYVDIDQRKQRSLVVKELRKA